MPAYTFQNFSSERRVGTPNICPTKGLGDQLTSGKALRPFRRGLKRKIYEVRPCRGMGEEMEDDRRKMLMTTFGLVQ